MKRLLTLIIVALELGCVPLLDESARPCPCGEGYRCFNGVCLSLPPPTCGDGLVEPLEGEQCDPGDDQQFIGHAVCESCAVVCEEGWGDCDEFTGCEQALDLQFTCGSCDHRCERDSNLCRTGRCVVPVTTEAQGIAAVRAHEDALFWLTPGTVVSGVHQNDAALRRRPTFITDGVDPVTMESALGAVGPDLEVAGINAEESLVWWVQVGAAFQLQRCSTDPAGFGAMTFATLGDMGDIAGVWLSTQHEIHWLGTSAATSFQIFTQVMGNPDAAMVASALEPGDKLLRTNQAYYWLTPTGLWRLPDGGAAEKVLTKAPSDIVEWRVFVYFIQDGNMHRINTTNGVSELVREDGAVYAVAGNDLCLFWLRHGSNNDELWAECDVSVGYDGEPFHLLNAEQPARLLTPALGGIAWVEGDAPAALYYWRSH